jgi:broad specificity phosphatase PhoE
MVRSALTIIHLVRHAEPDWSMVAEGRPYIDMLCPLSEEGIRQAMHLALNPLLCSAEMIISSPYTRALQTSAILSKEMQLPLSVEYDLREWVPCLQPKSPKESIIRAFKEDLRKSKCDDPAQLARGCVEMIDGVRSRTRRVLERYVQYSEVIAICHGVVIESQVEGVKVKYCGIVEISI